MYDKKRTKKSLSLINIAVSNIALTLEITTDEELSDRIYDDIMKKINKLYAILADINRLI